MSEHHQAGPGRVLARRTDVQDAALAAAVLLLCVLVNAPIGSSDGTATDARPALWWAATLVAAAGIAMRRRWPLSMLVLCTGAVVVHLALQVPLTVVDLSAPILLATVAIRHPWTVSTAALVAMLAVAAGSSTFAVSRIDAPTEVSQHQDRPRVPDAPPPRPAQPGPEVKRISGIAWDDLPALMVTLIASWAIGSAARSRRAHLDELHARAADLERQRDQQAALAVAAERSRLSRELHDVVAHGLSVMVIQAQGAAAALDKRPADTRTALAAIVKTGRDSLTDMRRVLATVDEVDDAWRPQPGLAALPALLDQVRETGTPVRLHIVGEPVPLPSTVDLSVYRIVQEALTNTMKHAGSDARAEVVLGYTATNVRIEVTDDGTGPIRLNGAQGGGNGLRGMRERIRLLGGSFEAGKQPSSGFAIRAVLPLRGHRP
ncbi:sensor histidine kinase [Virgisporangium aurantiacum]|nr:sensor histidine kinase [Virgisporangium aurantiacum]